MRARGCRGGAVATIAMFALLAAPAAAVDFGPPSAHGLFGDPFGLAVADLNHDGHPDLIAGVAGDIGAVSTLLGDGAGGFAPGVQSGVGSEAAFGVTAADFDGDGTLDVAAAAPAATSQVTVLPGKGDGTFHAPVMFSAAPSAVAIASGRFTGGTLPDIVTASDSLNEISLLRNATITPGTVSFAAPVQYAFGYSAQGLAVADFNRDHIPDLAVADFSENGKPSGFTILDGTGNATGFAAPNFTALGTDVIAVATADLNGDGSPDLGLLDADQRVYVLLNDGHGAFGAPASYDAVTGPGQPFPRAITFGDVERNGRPDLIVEETSPRRGDILIMHNKGNGTFTPASRFPSRALGDVVGTSDLNGDGAPDIIAGDSSGTASILLNIGQPSPSSAALSFGGIAVGSHSRAKPISIKNVGVAPMTIEGLSLVGTSPGSFDLDDPLLGAGAGTCVGTRLAAGASCSANVAFRPIGLGAATATLRVFSDTGAAPLDVPLGGSGLLTLHLAAVGHPHPGSRLLRVRASCSSTCSLQLTLSVSRRTAHQLHLRHNVLSKVSASVRRSRVLKLHLPKALSGRRSVALTLVGSAKSGAQHVTIRVPFRLRS